MADEQKQLAKLDALAQQSERVILSIRTVFPFHIFPDEVVLDLTKVSIIHHYFFASKSVRSIEYPDILNVIVEHSLFFATLEIVDRFFLQAPFVITYLKKKDAILARRVIQGLIIAKKEGVDLSAITDVRELLEKVEKVGRSR